MSDTYLISDTHFSHANILNFKDQNGRYFRGDFFNDVNEMNEKMIENWNKVVRPQDKVYHLGDVGFNRNQLDKILPRLNGKKRLLLGNHDTFKMSFYAKHFPKIYAYKHFKHNGVNVAVAHIPIVLNRRFPYMIHGHLHEKNMLENDGVLPDLRYFNVSVEQINYTPIALETVLDKLVY